MDTCAGVVRKEQGRKPDCLSYLAFLIYYPLPDSLVLRVDPNISPPQVTLVIRQPQMVSKSTPLHNEIKNEHACGAGGPPGEEAVTCGKWETSTSTPSPMCTKGNAFKTAAWELSHCFGVSKVQKLAE